MATTYQELRAAYDLAFQHFASEVRNVNRLLTCDTTESHNLGSARSRLTAAQHCYLQTRNALADHLLSHRAACRPTASETRKQPALARHLHAHQVTADQVHWDLAETNC